MNSHDFKQNDGDMDRVGGVIARQNIGSLRDLLFLTSILVQHAQIKDHGMKLVLKFWLMVFIVYSQYVKLSQRMLDISSENKQVQREQLQRLCFAAKYGRYAKQPQQEQIRSILKRYNIPTYHAPLLVSPRHIDLIRNDLDIKGGNQVGYYLLAFGSQLYFVLLVSHLFQISSRLAFTAFLSC